MAPAKLITEQERALETLGEHLRYERELRGYSQLSVATEAHVSQPLYAGIELGNRPLPIHRASEFGDSVVIGAIKFLITQLKGTRLELVTAGDERKCVESVATLSELIRKSSQVCAVISSALEDGRGSDSELDGMDDSLSQLEECVRQVRRDVAVRRELKRRERQLAPGLTSTRAGSGIQAKAVGK